MAIEDRYLGTEWRVDPVSGELRQMIHGDVVDTSGDLGEITGGALSMSGTTIRSGSTGRIAWNLSVANPSILTISTGGVVGITRSIDAAEVNSQTYSRARYGMTASGEYVLPDGTVTQIHTTSWLTRIGDRLVVKSDVLPGSEGRYAYASGLLGRDAPVGTPLPEGWEYAEPDVALQRSAIKSIIDDYRQLIDDMIAMGAKTSDGTPITNVYTAAQEIISSLTYQAGISAVLLG
jgi:hypothetical protein